MTPISLSRPEPQDYLADRVQDLALNGISLAVCVQTTVLAIALSIVLCQHFACSLLRLLSIKDARRGKRSESWRNEAARSGSLGGLDPVVEALGDDDGQRLERELLVVGLHPIDPPESAPTSMWKEGEQALRTQTFW